MDHRRIILMQWVVIFAMLVGGGVGGYLLVRKTDEYHTKARDYDGSVASLKEQVKQAKAARTPDPGAPLPEATGNGPASPTPSPKASATAKPR